MRFTVANAMECMDCEHTEEAFADPSIPEKRREPQTCTSCGSDCITLLFVSEEIPDGVTGGEAEEAFHYGRKRYEFDVDREYGRG